MEELRRFNRTNWCITQTNTVTIPFEWTIKNFSFHKRKVGYRLKSSTFSCENDEDETKWNLRLYPTGAAEKYKNYVAVFIYPEFNGRKEISAKFKVSFTSSVSGKANIERSKGVSQFDKKAYASGWNYFIETDFLMNEANGLLSNDTLTIRCEITVLTESFNSSGNAFNSTTIPSCFKMTDDFHSLFEKELFSDVILSAQGKQFKAHKCILSARSSYFAAMFTTEMKEKYQDVIEVSDVDACVLHDLLYFIYTGRVRDFRSVKITRNLFIAAEKYFLCGLKKMCEDILCKNISVSNVLNLFKCADMHSANQLKIASLDFIHRHISAVMKTESWLVLMHTDPNLLNEALEYNLQQTQKKD